MRVRYVAAVLASLFCTAAAGVQTQSASVPPAAVLAHIKGDRFQIVTSLRGLPLGVRGALQSLFGATDLDIAEPGAPFQSAARTNPSLPMRRLVAAGCSMDHCLVYYERGGAAPATVVAVFHWTPDATRFEWGGVAPRGLTTIEAVRQAILTGAVKGPNKVW